MIKRFVLLQCSVFFYVSRKLSFVPLLIDSRGCSFSVFLSNGCPKGVLSDDAHDSLLTKSSKNQRVSFLKFNSMNPLSFSINFI